MKLRYAIWERLKKAKKEKGLLYQDIAEKTNLSNSTLTTLFSSQPNYRVGKIIEIGKALEVDLPYIFGENPDSSLEYPTSEDEAVSNLWFNLDSYYMNPDGEEYYSRKKVYKKIGKAFYTAVKKDRILLSLDVLEDFSKHLKISPLRLISKSTSLEKLHFRRQNSIVCLHLQKGRENVATVIIDGDNSRYKVEDWLMGLLAGTREPVLTLNDINDKNSKLIVEWGEYLAIKLQKDGQELYVHQEDKEKANELLTKISRKERGYESYLNLLEAKENG